MALITPAFCSSSDLYFLVYVNKRSFTGPVIIKFDLDELPHAKNLEVNLREDGTCKVENTVEASKIVAAIYQSKTIPASTPPK